MRSILYAPTKEDYQDRLRVIIGKLIKAINNVLLIYYLESESSLKI
jgi:hypothetical protein